VLCIKKKTNELFLRLFYNNPAKYGFALQWGMLKTRIYRLRLAKMDKGRVPPKEHYFWDRSMIGDYIFALWNHLLGSISKEEMQVYESEFGGSLRDLASIPFLREDINLFLLLNDEPARCKWRVEEKIMNPSEIGIPLPYYEGLDDIHFHIFLKVIKHGVTPVVIVNWGQYDHAHNVHALVKMVLEGKRETPKVQHIEGTPRDDEDTFTYLTEQDILQFYEEIKLQPGEDRVTRDGERTKYGAIYIPEDICLVDPKMKNLVIDNNNYGIVFYENFFKRVVLWHLSHFQNIYFYKKNTTPLANT